MDSRWMRSLLFVVALATLTVGCNQGGSNSYGGASTTPPPPPPPDLTPPQVVSSSPENLAVGVAANVVVRANFNEALNPATVNSSTFVLRDVTTAITGTVSLSGTSAEFRPASPLRAGATYTARASTGIEDLAGNALAADFTWSFTIETVRPTVLLPSPAAGATGVPVDVVARATFSEPLDPASVNSGTFLLHQGTTPVGGSAAPSGSGVSFQPFADLTKATAYTATLTTGVRDLASNALATDFNWTFTTEIDAWRATSVLTPVPTARTDHAAVWIGSEMIVWGGTDTLGQLLNTGGRYNPNPIAESWNPTATSLGDTSTPLPRINHTAVWSGTEMIIWGGTTDLDPTTNTGGRYNPISNSWTKTSTTDPDTPLPRINHTSVWTGGQMIVWGGSAALDPTVNTGGRYNPISNSWTKTSTSDPDTPSPRINQTAFWTGNRMIIWGGTDASGQLLNNGGRYDPATDSWERMATANAPSARRGYVAVWTGSEMIVWGGSDASDSLLITGGRYNPVTNTWQPLSTAGLPALRADAVAVWTGASMIVWGGSGANGLSLNSGGRYDPVNDRWRTMTTGSAPDARVGHTGVWTGSEMIVWGGSTDTSRVNSGGRYAP